MKQIIIIADDLTGAADTGVQFCPLFENTTLVSYLQLDQMLDAALPFSTLATALYTNSRAAGADTARKRVVAVARRLAKEEPLWIYKKIDSCMRGNVGAEVEALLDALGYEISFIAPAFPEMGRTTIEDIHRIHGIPLNQTEISQDPVTPVTESRLSRIMAAQSRYPVAHVALPFLEGDQIGMREEIEHQFRRGVRHLVFDATCRAHLDCIAQMTFSLQHKILPVGSAGLAGSIADLLPLKPASDGRVKGSAPRGFNLLVCGSTSDVTGRQIRKLLENHSYEVICLAPLMLADQDRRDDFLKALSSAQSSLLKKNVILTIEPRYIDRTAHRPADCQQAAASVARGLGRFVAGVAATTKPGHLFLTGGDTADAVLSAIEAKGIRISGEIVAGVVQGVLLGGPLNGMPVVTKAGAFGREDTLVTLHEIWEKREERCDKTL
jgi:uncharacterized protein YgbK (DUF1537 family)